MNKKNVFGILAIVVVVVLACGGFALYAKSVIDADPTFWSEYEAAKARSSTPEYQAQLDAENKEMSDKTFPYVVGALVFFGMLAFGVFEKIGKPLVILLLFIALLAGVGYLFTYSGGEESIVITSVDPTGDNAQNDAAYSKVNTENAKANMTNMMTMGFLWVIGAIVIFVLGFTSIYLGSWNKNNLQ